MADDHRCGVVAIAGRPNVGKSTLLNQVLGTKIAIVTPKPQTTRDRILGILTLPDAQVLFHDTPGIHVPSKALNRRMVRLAEEALADADLVLLVTDAHDPATCLEEEALVLDRVRGAGRPTLLVLNKIDLRRKADLLPCMDRWRSAGFEDQVPVSALTGDGVDRLIEEVRKRLPVGPPLYPEDDLSDRPVRYLASEVLREKVFLSTRQEIPYSIAVTIDQFQEPEPPRAIQIDATIHVEKESQKPIVIGRNGAMLKRIGMAARQELEAILGRSVMLRIFVRVDEDWTRSDRLVRSLLDEGT
ncbi:MAG TPA: GTPase Era [Myxococcota bacterium]|nr:GTPase Era [Myxococcota bacterium]HQK49640.1 GTPase Era [Myxococcota bacterium]